MTRRLSAAVILPPTLTPADPDYARERYTTAQAAEYLGLALGRVYTETAGGRLAHRRDGFRGMRFSQADLDAWRTQRRVDATARTERPRREPTPTRPVVSRLHELPMPKVRVFS